MVHNDKSSLTRISGLPSVCNQLISKNYDVIPQLSTVRRTDTMMYKYKPPVYYTN